MTVTAAQVDAFIQAQSSGPINKEQLARLLKELAALSPTPAGTVGPAAGTVLEYGDDYSRTTRITVNGVLPDIAGGASLAVGLLMYTFPAGAIIVESSYLSIALMQTDGNVTADTPEVGLGTTIGTGAIATLSTTMEDLVLGSPAAADVNNTPTVKAVIPTAGVPFVILAAAAHTVYLNVADGWAASGDDGILVTGTVVLNWRFLN